METAGEERNLRRVATEVKLGLGLGGARSQMEEVLNSRFLLAVAR